MIEKMIEELVKWCKSVKKSDEQPVEVQNEEVTTCKSEDKPKRTVSYTATDIFNYLQKRYPAAMRGVTPIRLGRMLTSLGVKRVHTEYGNVYRLVMLKDSSLD